MGLRAGLHAPARGDRFARCPVGGAGKPLPGLASGGPCRPPPTLGSVPRLLSCVLWSGSAGRALLCPLGARGRSSAADGSTALQEGQMAPGSFLLLGSDHNVTPKGSKFIKGFLWGLEICDRFSIPLNSLLKFNAAIKMMDNKLFQEK